MLKKIKEISGKTGEVLQEYPMVLLMALLGAISFMCSANINYSDHNFIFVKFGIVSCLGISLMFAIKILSQRIGKRLMLEIAGTIFLIFFYFLLPDEERHFTERYAFLLIPTFILSHLLVSFIAFTGKNTELNFWQYNKNLFVTIFLTAVFTGVLTGGVQLAILAVDKLFDFNFKGTYYTQTFYFFSIFGSALIFLLFNEKGLQYLEKESSYPQILKFFTQYILVPLLIIYSVILYFYSAKILINWELPRGWVSYLVLAYSVVGILALLLVYPLKENSARSWVKMFSKIYYYTLIPLIGLLFVAIFTRILEYGYTEPRYFVLLIALWLTSVVLYFIFIKRATIKFIPISLFVFGLFSLIFPYLNTFSVSKRSQKTELQQVLQQNNLLEKGTINFSTEVSDTIADEISSKFDFLVKRDEKDFLLKLLKEKDQKIIVKSLEEHDFYQVRSQVRFAFLNVQKTKKSFGYENFELISENKLKSINGYDYLIRAANFYNENGLTIDKDVFRITSQQENGKLLILTVNNKEKWDATPEIKQLISKYHQRTGRLLVPEINLEHDLGKYHIKIIFDNMVRQSYTKENIYFGEAYILIRRK